MICKNKISNFFKLGSVNHYKVWVAFSLMDIASSNQVSIIFTFCQPYACWIHDWKM